MSDDGVYKVAVLDMQPIDPPVGGGRIRLLGLYHALGPKLAATYVGSYDWPGPGERRHKLSDTLEEIDIPLSARHFEVVEKWKGFANGKTIIDSTFSLMAPLSHDYTETVRKVARDADIVVFSHPWVYPLVRDVLEVPRQLVVYDSQNHEGLLKYWLLDDDGLGTEVAKHVAATEYELAWRADLLCHCSSDDARLFNEIYGVSYDKMVEVPNGVFSTRLVPPTPAQKASAKKSLRLKGKSAIFLASAFGTNVEAVKFICNQVAPAARGVDFVICGGVADAAELIPVKAKAGRNVRFIGFVPEKEKLRHLWAADLAINPMFTGSGTNIKMFDFMAAGLPVVSTPVGARGIEGAGSAFLVSDADAFAGTISSVLEDEALLSALIKNGRRLVEEKYSWEKISPGLGDTLWGAMARKRSAGVKGSLATEMDSSNVIPEEKRTTDGAAGKLEKRRLAILTAWDDRCGIAEHSRYVVSELKGYNVECVVLAHEKDDAADAACIGDGSLPAAVHQIWRHGDVDPDKVVQGCKNAGIDKLNVQYHPAFFKEAQLLDVAEKAIGAGIDMSVALHNTKNMELESLLKLGETGASLIVHDASELRRLTDMGVKRITHVKVGVMDVPDEPVKAARDRLGIRGNPVIGSFGFLRPHKGLLELIEAVSILRDIYPDIFLQSMTALYPSQDSEEYLARCRERIEALDLGRHVKIETGFLEIKEVIKDLHACDVMVLPYHFSDEGASGVVKVALATMRPVITSSEDIFKEVTGMVYKVESVASPVLAAGIAGLLSSPMLMQSLVGKAGRYVEGNTWAMVARRYRELMFEERLDTL